MSGLPEVGERYGRYQISRLVGEDGAGVVYEATDTMLRRSVALTVVGHDHHETFSRESALRARIRSRHVVSVLDHGTIDGSAYSATDHFPDGDLATWLRTHGPMPRTDALALTSQVCVALADAHAAGVVHPGLAPGTILLRSEPGGLSPHLSDLGSAVVGRDEERADQHAVGTLLWTCLTGAAPAAADPVPQLPASSAEDRVINGLLLRLLSPDPEDRFASMGELRAAVDRLATRGTSLTASPTVTPMVTLPVAPVAAGETVRAEPMLFRSPEALAAQAQAEAETRPQLRAEPVAPASPAPLVAPPLPPVAAAPDAPEAPAVAAAPTPAPRRRAAPISPSARRRPWWIVAVAALVLILGGAAFGLTRGGGDADAQALSVSPTPTAAASPTPSLTPTPTPSPSAAVTPSPPAPKPAIGPLTRSDAACIGTAGNYQKWAYPLTGFKPGRVLHPQLAIRSDRGNGETAGKPVTVGPKGRATGDFCVPAGTHGTVTITVAGMAAKRPIG